MIGWRSRLGFLVPPGNPTVEAEMAELAPAGVSVHFTRMTASGPAGTHAGQEERNRQQLESVDSCVALLSMVQPDVIVLAHTATSYTLGREREQQLADRVRKASGINFITAFGSVIEAFRKLDVKRVAYATPYSTETTLLGKKHIEEYGFEVASYGHLDNVRNIYEENCERAYAIARQVDTPEADAVFLSGVGMPTIGALQTLEDDLGKPVFSAAAAMMWNALRTAGVRTAQPGYGRLFG
jgi:maleate cis-trans isomerase